LTFDHSLVWELVRRKHLSPEQAGTMVPRNVITRSLGPDPQVDVDTEGPLPVEEGDVFLLCSDGLSGPVTDPELGTFADNFHPDDACRYLLQLANMRGGPDNITVLVVRVGPWVEPSADGPAEEEPEKRKKSGKGFLSGLLGSFGRRQAAPEVEEHLYQSAACTLDTPVIDRITEQVRHVQAHAIEQAWPVDWPVLTNLRREGDAARASGELRAALRCLGESIVLLGTAGRRHKKAQNAGVG
jgi:hypothetical protein